MAKKQQKMAKFAVGAEKTLARCGNNGNNGKYGIHFQGTPVTMRAQEPDQA
jgi:hypothetical protein